MMIDLHTHSLLSDGELLPSELARRAEVLGYEALAITDHADISNMDFIVPRIVKFCRQWNGISQTHVFPGIELTHLPPDFINKAAIEARKLGAQIVVVHGETIAEPVAPGTNKSALLSPVDILAHPGLITEEEVKIAKEKGIFLEITTRKGHSLANGHVARLAGNIGAKLILNTDSHAPDDLVTFNQAKKIALGAGLSVRDFEKMVKNSRDIIKKFIL